MTGNAACPAIARRMRITLPVAATGSARSWPVPWTQAVLKIHNDRQLANNPFSVGNYMLSSFSWKKY